MEGEILPDYPNIDNKGLKYAKEALIDLLEQVADFQVLEPGGWEVDIWGPDE